MSHQKRLARARVALDGLSVGDGFGERFFSPLSVIEQMIRLRALPAPPWLYTDDTEMALAIYEVLATHHQIDQDALAEVFARRYVDNPTRGYGGGAHGILRAISFGEPWAIVSKAAFNGTGSMGNGGAMRVAPVGAYFADDLNRVVREARASAEVTHAHPEGVAGAIAIAVAVAWACQNDQPRELFQVVLDHTPAGPTREGILEASQLSLDASVKNAVAILGNGSDVLARDTVPFSLWCAARHAVDFQRALWTAVEGGGDLDTVCAIVGGIVAFTSAIPEAWLQSREPLSTQ